MTEVAQEYNGTVTVATAELNPILGSVLMLVPDIGSYVFYLADGAIVEDQKGEKITGTGTSFNNVLIDLSFYLPTMFQIITYNNGDENLDVRMIGLLDGVIVIDQISKNCVPPALGGTICFPFGTTNELEAYLGVGLHTMQWIISARRSGTADAFVEYITDTVTYHCYTLGLDAIATQVGFVQNGIEQNWLTWTGTEFVPSAVLIEPDTATTTRFHFSNAGDELVRMYVGHLAEDGVAYDTGVVINDVTIYDTVEPYVDIAAGESATLDVIDFVPTASFTISFVILRERML